MKANSIKLLTIISLFLTIQCSTYRIPDERLNDLNNQSGATIEFSFAELNSTPNNPHVDESWRCFMFINNIDIYNCWYFNPNETINVPIPIGDVKLDFRLSNMSGLNWCSARFDSGKTVITLSNVKLGEKIKIQVRNIDQDVISRQNMSSSAATAGPIGLGCFMIMPREYYIHLGINRSVPE